MESVLTVQNLSKWYGKYHAIKGISFELKKGEILGLLGPNGAGKTTTIQMLLGLTNPDGGSIQYFGKDFHTNKEYCLSRINFASAYSKLQGKISVRQSLHVHGLLYGVKNISEKINELAEELEITHILDEVFWHLSSGQQTRAILAKALLSSPKLLLMDEPTASLDPEIVHKIINVVRDLRENHQVSILFTSHNMEEVTRICDRVMFLRSGVIEAIDTPLGLTKSIRDAKLLVGFEGSKERVQKVLTVEKYRFSFIKKQLIEIELPEDQIPSMLFAIKKADIFISHIEINKPTLEDVFLAMARKQKESV